MVPPPHLQLALATLLCCVTLSAQRLTAQGTGAISGTVMDSSTRQPLRGATVTLLGTPLTARAADDGRFVLSRVPVGAQRVHVRAPGYTPIERSVTVVAGENPRLDLSLSRTAQLLGAARAEAVPEERERFERRPNVGTIALNARAMDVVPRLGDADPVRVVQFLPGVEAKNDFSSGFNVRGGESDQNLILLDGYPVYNPFHLGGVFSTFIDVTVRDVQLHTGAIPAREGGRLSSLLDVRSKAEARSGVHGTAELSLLAATGSAGGAFDGGRGSWNVAARRTYADKVARFVTSEEVPYHFRDAQAHATWVLPANIRISATVYDGEDVLDGSYATFSDNSREGADGGDFFYSWRNRVLGTTLSRVFVAPRGRWFFGDSAVVEQKFSISQFSSLLDLGAGTTTYSNDLSDRRAAGAVTGFGKRHVRIAGYEFSAIEAGYAVSEGQGSLNNRDGRDRPVVAAAFAEDLWRVSPRLVVSGGARFERMAEARWASVSPRVSAKFFATPDAAFTVAAGRYAQWTHSLALEDNPIRLFDAWRTSSATNPVSTAWQFVAGHERWFGASRFVRVESFYKKYDELLEADLEENTRLRTDNFVVARGRSFGADLLVRQLEVGQFSGWLAYTWAVSERQTDSIRYSPAHDRRHDLNIVGGWRLGAYLVGARVGYGSGMPYTEIIGSIPRRRWDPVTGVWGGGERRVQYEGIGDLRNGSRLPPTRRIDVSVERRFELRRATVRTHLSVINATNAPNVLYYTYDYTTAPGTRRTVSQLPIIPSLGVSIAF